MLQRLGVRDDLLVHERANGREDFFLDVRETRGLGEARHRTSLPKQELPASMDRLTLVCDRGVLTATQSRQLYRNSIPDWWNRAPTHGELRHRTLRSRLTTF
ncbi:hypothetical protein GCM10027200_78260 [Lentzea nigeriaca]